ncbi:MAG: guanylate kinase [candidate division Zixibacteria bacterium]|nr:guanylate kinase [candidate division Zixibacteria bacterium]
MGSRWVGTELLVVISAPSGGGKSTVIARLRQRHPEFMYSVSVTTRPRRKGERQNKHYGFVTMPEFERMRKKDELIEWARVHDHFYGTPRRNVVKARRAKRVMLFDVDVQGAASVRRAFPDVVSIFLLPPSWAILRQRLSSRHSESPAQLRLRLRTARRELARSSEYQYWVTNDRLERCVADCESIIRAEILRRGRRKAPVQSTRVSRG